MAEYFWEKVEGDLGEIPAFIKNAFNMNGFGNALTFKDVDEDDIDTVEQFVRNELLGILSKNASESMGECCEALVDDQQMLEHFGEAYKEAPENFKFLNGHKKLIRNVAAHVKRLVDGKGANKGLKLFQPKQTTFMHAIKSEPNKYDTQDTNTVNVFDEENSKELLPQLESSLFTKVMECLEQYQVAEQVDLNSIDQSIVSVVIECGKFYGDIICVICQLDPKKNKHKQKPKRISYTGNPPYWVPSNFITHLRGVHKLSKKIVGKNTNPTEISTIDNQTIHEHEVTLDASLQIVSEKSAPLSTIKLLNLYEQISTQITTMSKAVLDNSERESQITIMLSASKSTSISVVAAASDGNCLFRSLAHQLFGHKMQSEIMRKAIKELRANVVSQIKNHMDSYQHELKGRAYDIIEDRREKGEPSASIDIDKEVEFFVNQLLPRNRYWGGTETLKAVSDLYKVNIFIFVENETYHVITEEGQTYERSIAVAFRNGNHYDSITDIAANDIYALTSNE